MKKMTTLKLIQLAVFLLITGISMVLIVFDPDTRNYVGKNPHILVVCLLLWITLVLSFVFIYLDYHTFTGFRRNVKKLNQVAHADMVAGIPNRFSCDSLIEKYIGAPLPANIGCVMIDITNIIEINQEYGREAGDHAIRQFSDALHLVVAGQCFIGRNGGNKFIALFENCDKEQLENFVERLHSQIVESNNEDSNVKIHYKYGLAFHGVDSNTPENMQITDLISNANNQIYKKD